MAIRRSQRRWYFCHQVGMSEATYVDICFRHQLLISLRLFIVVVGKIGFGRTWRIARWWR
jgi:hypothetical protein